MDNCILDSKNIGIIGGTFDPVHYGHLLAAKGALEKFNLDKVIFLPVGKHAYKNNEEIIHKNHRYEMLLLATLSNINFYISDLELKKEEKSYTVDTMKEIKKIYKNNKIFFIIGSDLIEEILTWKNIKELFDLCEFIIILRDYNNKNIVLKAIADLEKKFNKKINFLEINNINISSTDIRKKISEKKSIKYLLPENVEKYIYRNNLYENKEKFKLDIKLLDKLIKNNLSDYRYNHSKRVASVSYYLAKIFKEDKNKAYFVGMFHDFAKEMSAEEKFNMCKKYNIKLDYIEKISISIAHGRIAAEISKDFFKIKDKDILNSMIYHTTGRKNMTNFEKIIYLADKIEPGRGNNKNLEYIRKIIYEDYDLDKALVESLKFTMEICAKEKTIFHPLSLEALTYLEKNVF